MRKHFYIFFLMIAFSFPLMAQGGILKGVVIDKETKEPLIGASVRIKDSRGVGVVTDVNGEFSLDIKSSQTILQVNYIGYNEVQVEVGNATSITISLDANDKNLDEVVVIGYAAVNKRDLTGSVSSVNARQLKDIPVASAAEALAGRLAGVQITSAEGAPGANITVRVRGGGSITQDNSPLYVVDGVQMESGLDNISPQEIESVDVLKDASATAIYGARGANGVVVITTKSGKESKTTVNYNGMAGVSYLTKKMEVLSPYDFVLHQYERSRGSDKEEQLFESRYGTFADIESYKEKEMINWQEEMMGNTGTMQTHNVNITGGNKNTNFVVNYEYNKNKGIVTNSGFTRHQVSLKLNHTFNPFFRFGTTIRYNNQVIDGAGISSDGVSSLNSLRNLIKYRPFVVPGAPEDEFDPNYTDETNAGNGLGLINPKALFRGQFREYKQSNIIISSYINLDFTNYLSLRSTIGLDLSNARQNTFDDYMTPNALYNYDGMPYVRISDSKINTLNQSNVLTYTNKKIKSKFHKENNINFIIGQEIYTYHKDGIDNRFKWFPVGINPENALQQVSMGTIVAGYPLNTFVENKLLSFFSRLNYSYKNKYLATFTYRADGSSKFAKDNNWGYFPSGSFAWRVSQEDFMKNIHFLSDLKLRVGYGQSGNNRISDYMYQTYYKPDIYGLNNNASSGALIPNTLGNSKLKWETTTSKNIGIDFTFLKNRIQMSIDLYRNDTDDLLLESPISFTSGYKTQTQNTGATFNEGIETQLQAMIIDNKDFAWSVNFNIACNKNEIKRLSSGQESFLKSSGWGISGQPADYIVKVGEPVGTIWGYESDGFYTVDDFDYAPDPAKQGWGTYTLKEGLADPSKVIGSPQPGMMKFKSGDDGVLDERDKKILGCASPKLTGGLNQQFKYRNFDASIFVNFQYGNKVLNANKVELSNGYSSNSNLLGFMKDRWTVINSEGELVQRIVAVGGKDVVQGVEPAVLQEINKGAQIWMPNRAASGFFGTSWAVEDASFLRINNITLGYTLPKSFVLTKLKITKLRLYATANNLAVITNYSGYDPEVDTRRGTKVTPGVDYSAYPRSRSFLFGVNLTF